VSYEGKAYQLRGMATTEKYRGQGIGNQLVNFAIVYLRGQKANYVWCNARKAAVRFYKNLGFEIISNEFEVPSIGPHYVMYVKIHVKFYSQNKHLYNICVQYLGLFF
jgi:ribosomal protein S18 acetylase RimI-like enzyme